VRVNVYAEEMTNRVELVEKNGFTGVRFWLELPVTVVAPKEGNNGTQTRGPFIHQPGDDDSAAVTFWGKAELKTALTKALKLLEDHK